MSLEFRGKFRARVKYLEVLSEQWCLKLVYEPREQAGEFDVRTSGSSLQFSHILSVK